MDDSTFDAAALCDGTFLRSFEFHESLDSTNNYVLQVANDASLRLPLAVVARQQTAGRGRGQNTWWSSKGALTFSLLIEPAAHGITVSQWPQLSLTTAVAITDAIDAQLQPSTQPPPHSTLPLPHSSVKWPNDILLGDRKLAGILIESPARAPQTIERLAIGIGINVNNSWHDAPPEVAARATSLFDIHGERFDRQQILKSVFVCLENRLVQLAAGDATLADDWQRRSWLTGRNVTIEDALGRSTSGRCLGIDRDAAILIETSAGIERVFSGTVVQSTV